MGNLHLVTGYQGQEHVTAADHGSLYAAIFGSGNYVLDRGNKLAASVITSNQIRIADGDIVLQGRHIRLNEGASVDLTIANGAQGYKRNDLIVARYTRNPSTGIEEASLVVIKGTAVTSNPADPAYNTGDILTDHAETADFPLYRVPVDGLTVQPLVALFKIVPAYGEGGLDYISNEDKGKANGVASLDSSGKVPSSQLPSMNYIPTSQKGVANGVAPLNANKKIDNAYLPTIPTVSTSVTSTSTTTAASSSAVKQAYDRAASYVSSQRGATNGLAPLQNGKLSEGYLPDSLFVSDQRVQTFSDEGFQTGFINSAEIRFARVGKLVVVEGSFYVNNSNCAQIKISFSGNFPRPSIVYTVLPLGILYQGMVSADEAPNCPAYLDFNESSSAVKLKWYPNALLPSGFYNFTASYITDQ